MPVLILEGVGVSAAIGRSVTLTKAHTMHVLGLVLTAQLLATVVNGALAEGVNLLVHTGRSTVAAVIGQSIASTIAGVLTTPVRRDRDRRAATSTSAFATRRSTCSCSCSATTPRIAA